MLETEEGKIVFPNLNSDDITYIEKEKDGVLYLKEKECLFVGCGRDPRFDPNAHPNNPWDSASSMMTRHLGLFKKYPIWRKVIEEVRSAYRGRQLESGEIALMADALYGSHGGLVGDASVIQWVKTAYDAEIHFGDKKQLKPLDRWGVLDILKQQNSPSAEWFEMMISECQSHYERSKNDAKTVFVGLEPKKFNHPIHGELNLYIVSTDNEKVASYAWKNTDADILVVLKSNGQVAIQTKRERLFDMTEVWQKIVELEPKGRGSELWDLYSGPRMILNGSRSNPNTPPTKLTLEEIAEIIQNVLTGKEYLDRMRPSVGDMLEAALSGFGS